jgi:hypothetical protein
VKSNVQIFALLIRHTNTKVRLFLSIPGREKRYSTHEHQLGGERSTSCPSYFTPREEPPYPLNRRQGAPTFWGKVKFLAPTRIWKKIIIHHAAQAH